MTSFASLSSRLFALAFVAVAMAGCYLPIRFDSEVELQRTGYYTAIFDGYLADVGIYDELRRSKLSPADEKQKVAQVLTDLKRDSDVSVADYMQNGIFHVTWKHQGDVIQEKMYTFIRRNEAFLTFKYDEEKGEIVISGRKLKTAEVERLEKMGLGAVEGQLRVLTSARVSQQNAQQVLKRKGGGFIYVWNIKSFKDPAPKLVVPVR